MSSSLAEIAKMDQFLKDERIAHLMIDRNEVISKTSIFFLFIFYKC